MMSSYSLRRFWIGLGIFETFGVSSVLPVRANVSAEFVYSRSSAYIHSVMSNGSDSGSHKANTELSFTCWSLDATTSTSIVLPYTLNLNFLELPRMSAWYLMIQSVPKRTDLAAEFTIWVLIYVTASAITTWRFSTSPKAGWGLPSMNITFFLDDGIHLRPKAWARGFVITDIHVLVSTIVRIAFSLILA